MDFAVAFDPKTVDIAALHQAARGTSEDWPAFFTTDDQGETVYRVQERDGVAVDPATVRDALNAPQPPPTDPEDEFRAAVEEATSVTGLKAALLGTSGPGAQARRGRRQGAD